MIRNGADDLVILEEVSFACEFVWKFLEWEVISIIFHQVFNRNNLVFYPIFEIHSFVVMRISLDRTLILFLILWRIQLYSYKRLAVVGDALDCNCILKENLRSPIFWKNDVAQYTNYSLPRSRVRVSKACKSQRSKHNSTSVIRFPPFS